MSWLRREGGEVAAMAGSRRWLWVLSRVCGGGDDGCHVSRASGFSAETCELLGLPFQ